MRKIIYVSGTRAEFGLLQNALKLLHSHPEIDLSICVTSMHMHRDYGYTVKEIEESNLPICARIVVPLDQSSGAVMGKSIGYNIIEMINVFERESPDFILVLGDRGEMLAAAIAANHLNIPVIHIHGGDMSGHVDDRVRHAISKLADFHFAASPGAQERLSAMGIPENTIFLTGAPGLDDIFTTHLTPRNALFKTLNFDLNKPVGLVLFHAVLEEYNEIREQTKNIIEAALQSQLQLLCLLPNSDAGGHFIRDTLFSYQNHPDIRLKVHLERSEYLSWMNAIDIMIGNSSCGIIESASFGLPVLNIGTRQKARERNPNVLDVSYHQNEIYDGIQKLLKQGKCDTYNLYGDGKAGQKICTAVLELPLQKRKIGLKKQCHQ